MVYNDGMGRLIVITGPMYSKKTARLIEYLDSSVISGKITVSFKPNIDNRYNDSSGIVRYITSHTGSKFPTIPVKIDEEGVVSILKYVHEFDKHLEDIGRRVEVIGIDEAQFFDKKIIDVCNKLVSEKKIVVVSGLNLDFRGEPFGPMPWLLAYADEIIKLNSICRKCGREATKTQRLIDGKPARYDDPVIVVGADDKYVARCNDHHEVPGKPSIDIDEDVEINRQIYDRFVDVINEQMKKPKLV